MSTPGPADRGPRPPEDPWTDLTDPAPPGTASPAAATFQPGHAQPEYQPSRYQPDDRSGSWAAPGYAPRQGYAPQDEDYGYDDGGMQREPRRRNTPVIVLSIMLVLVVLAGIGVGAYLYANRSAPAKFVIPQAGQCVRSNAEDEPKTKMTIASCGPDSYKVLKTVVGTDQASECANVPGITNAYHFTPTDGDLDRTYVLCLGPSSQ